MVLIDIVEDDNNIQEIEAYALGNNGYQVRCFPDAATFYAGLKEQIPDLLLLDIMLPGEDGLSVLRKVRAGRETKNLPVIMVTAKDSEIDTVKGLDLGADDYISKPFGIMELISRVKAILRRVSPSNENQILEYKTISLDQERRVCHVDGEVCELTYKEYELLRLFLSNVGIVLSRDTIMNSVWDSDYVGESRTVDMHIKTLRKKLGSYGNSIVTIRNVGYKLE